MGLRWFSVVFMAIVATGPVNAAGGLPTGFELHKFNASQKPVAEDGVVTFHIIPDDCSSVDYGDGRGESDCTNGNTKSIIRKKQDARLGETLDYRFDVWVDPDFGYEGYYRAESVPFRKGGWDSRLRVASWEGEYIKNFIYILKLDSRDGLTFFGEQCQSPEHFGEWVSVSLKVRWASDARGWAKFTCDDRIVWSDEATSSTAQIQCYLANECQPGVVRNPKRFNYILGLAMNGVGFEWEKLGFESPFTKIPDDGLTIKMRNISVTKGAELYSDEDKAVVKALQERLNALGCDVGTADGVVGPRTREAAKACGKFDPPWSVPDKLSLSTLRQFLDIYNEMQSVPAAGE